MKLRLNSLLGAATLAAPLLSQAALFEDATKHLDTDGSLIAYINFAGDGAEIGKQLNTIYQEVLTVMPAAAMFPLDFEQLIDELGFGSMQGMGMSSKTIDDGLQINRLVMLTGGELSGLFAAYGNTNAPTTSFTLAERAPADTTTAVSGPFHLTAVRDTLVAIMTQSMGPMGESIATQQLSTPILGTDMTANEVIEALSGQLEFCMHQSYTDTMDPVIKIWANVSDAGHLVARLKPLEANIPITFADDDSKLVADCSALIGQEAFGLFLEQDKASGALTIYTHRDWNTQTTGPKLAETEAFAEFKDLLPKKAHWFTYTKGARHDLDAMFAIFEQIPEAAPYANLGRNAYELILGDFLKPAAGATTITEDAIVSELYASYSYKQMAMVLPTLFAGGVGAAMAIPAFQKVRTTSQEKAITNNLRQIASAADQYMLEEGATEVHIDQLIGPEKYISQLDSIAGESYDDIVITADTEELSVELPNGSVISYPY